MEGEGEGSEGDDNQNNQPANGKRETDEPTTSFIMNIRLVCTYPFVYIHTHHPNMHRMSTIINIIVNHHRIKSDDHSRRPMVAKPTAAREPPTKCIGIVLINPADFPLLVFVLSAAVEPPSPGLVSTEPSPLTSTPPPVVVLR